MNIQDLTLDKLVEALFLIPMESDEVWREINFLPQATKSRYFVSNKGKVISLCRNQPVVLKPFVCGSGYKYVSIGNKDYKVSRLVAQAFIPNPKNKPIVHHKDHNKLNNDINNLEWVTHQENIIAYHEQKDLNE